MGSISDYQYEEYVTEKGYNAKDLIGKDGIEASMESYLKGVDGVKSVRVNSSGDYISTISETDPVAGKNVYLTIDLELQKTAESALAQAIQAVQTGSTFRGEYGSTRMSKFANCGSGAAVAIDVETGDVLGHGQLSGLRSQYFCRGNNYRGLGFGTEHQPERSSGRLLLCIMSLLRLLYSRVLPLSRLRL